MNEVILIQQLKREVEDILTKQIAQEKYPDNPEKNKNIKVKTKQLY